MESETEQNLDFALAEGERLDDLVRGGLKIIQSPSAFCFSMDAVLLANFATVKKGDKIVDLGTGTGVIPLLVSTRNLVKEIIGLEIQDDSVDRALRNVKGNKLDHLIQIVQGDICKARQILGTGKYDLILSNPPYLPVGRGDRNQIDSIAVAKHEILCNLENVIDSGSGLVKYGGRFALVHRPERLTEIIILMNKYQLKPRKLQFVYPRVNSRPNMILIEAQYGGNPELIIMEPFIVYNESGNYTKEFWNTYYPGIPYKATVGGLFEG